jgi:hypothetical protein
MKIRTGEIRQCTQEKLTKFTEAALFKINADEEN